MPDHASKLREYAKYLRENVWFGECNETDHDANSLAALLESLGPVVKAVKSELSNFDNAHSCVPHIRKNAAEAFLTAVEELK